MPQSFPRRSARRLALLAGAAFVSAAAPALAQRTVPAELLLAEGQPLPSVGGVILELDTPVLDADGKVGLNGKATIGGIDRTFVFVESSPIFLDSTAPAGYTLSGREISMGISPGGQFIYSPSINGNDGLWSSAGYVIANRDPAPGATGKFIKFASGPRMAADGRFTFMAGFSNTPGGTTTDRAVYQGRLGVPGLTLLYKTGDTVDGQVLRFTTPNLSFKYDVSSNAQHLIHISGVGAGSGSTWVLKDGTWIAQPATQLPGSIYANEAWNTFNGVGVNDAGDWIIYGFSSNYDDPTSNDFVAFNGVDTLHENQTIDGLTLATPASVRAAALNNLGRIAMIWQYGSSVAPTPKALVVGEGGTLAQSIVVVASGDLLDVDGDGSPDWRVVDLPDNNSVGIGLDLADDGRVATTCTLEPPAGGTRFDATIRFCYAECSACPPCAGDFNQDGGIDGGDIESFFAAWEASDPCGDVNQDGGVTGDDVGSFFSTWEAGGC
ncbi:MAG: DUF7453 family protein [Phycisphaerales bacterium]|jgi:hypothetical protein